MIHQPLMANSVLTPVCCGLHPNVGASRGFAFVEFVALEDAVRYMEAKQVMRVLQLHQTLTTPE